MSADNANEADRRNQWAREHWFPTKAVGFRGARVCYTKRFQKDIKIMERKYCHVLDDIKSAVLELLVGGKEATRVSLLSKVVQRININGIRAKLPQGCMQSCVGKWRFYWYHDADTNTIAFYRIAFRPNIT